MTNFSDIFKKGFLNNGAVELNFSSILSALLAAFLCGMIIYFVYRRFYKGVIYNNNFNILLVLVCVVTAFIVLTISSNVVLSLGMVGALSIVRFRTAVKDPLDVGFLFCSVAIGITCGAGLYLMSLICTVFVAVVYIILVHLKSSARVYLLIVKFDSGANEEVQRVMKPFKNVLKNKTAINDKIELTLEVKTKAENTSFVTALSGLNGVYSATLVEYTGNFGE